MGRAVGSDEDKLEVRRVLCFGVLLRAAGHTPEALSRAGIRSSLREMVQMAKMQMD